MLTTEYTIAKKKIKRDQTALDYTTQFGGDLEAAFDMLLLNGLSLTQNITPGTLLQAPVVNKKVISFYDGSELDIITILKQGQVLPGGIGYMQIQNDFIVS